MNVEEYEPLVRQLCQGIFDPHTRSEAEQEARIRLWLNSAKVDAANNPARLANTMIRRARADTFLGKTWTGRGTGHKRCEHGDTNRRSDGRCRVCRAEYNRRRRSAQAQAEGG